MDDHKPVAIAEGSRAMLDVVLESSSDGASMERYRKTETTSCRWTCTNVRAAAHGQGANMTADQDDPTKNMTPRELDAYYAAMTPEELRTAGKVMGEKNAALRAARLARGVPDIDWGQATVDALRRATREE